MKTAMMMNDKAIVSSKGQVVIPKALRKALGIHTGTELVFKKINDALVIKPAQRNIEMFFGCCKNTNQTSSIVDDIDQAIMHAVLNSDKATLNHGTSHDRS